MQLRLNLKANGVPVLSKKDIDSIALDFLREYEPDCLKMPQSTDINLLIRGGLKMSYEEEYLSSNGLYLGLTVFEDGKIIVYNPVKNEAEYRNVAANTIIIDKSLCADDMQSTRKRFTEAHEAGHALLHREYYKRAKTGDYQLNTDEVLLKYANGYAGFTDTDWLEWQANCFASSVLMPENSIREVALRYKDLDEDKRNNLLIVAVSTVFDVSETAALLRLKSLGIVNKNYTPEINEIKYLRQFKSGLRLNRNGGQ